MQNYAGSKASLKYKLEVPSGKERGLMMLGNGISNDVLDYVLATRSAISEWKEDAAWLIADKKILNINNAGVKESISKTRTPIPKKSLKKQAASSKVKPIWSIITSYALSEATSEQVIIHVHDKPRYIKTDFLCARTTLILEMKYFESCIQQHLIRADFKEIDIHCDSHVFQSVLDFINKDELLLDNNNVLLVLNNASFLKIGRLVDKCLGFIKTNFDDLNVYQVAIAAIGSENGIKQIETSLVQRCSLV